MEILSYCHWVTPWSLLAVTAALGMGSALQTPAWHTSQAEAVPRALLPAALTLSTTSYNAARAVGPALAGVPGTREEFIRAAHALGRSRRRDGANVWRLYRDLSDPNCYVERFMVDSWSEYLRHRARATVADQEAQLRIASMLIEGTTPKTEHFIAEADGPRGLSQ